MPVLGLVPVPAIVVGPSGLPTNPTSLAIRTSGGDYWSLTDASAESRIRLMPGMTGFDLPPLQAYADDSPGLPGANYQGSKDLSRPLFIPIHVEGATRLDAIKRRRDLLVSIHPSRGPVTIVFGDADGQTRYIDCYYESGAEGAEGSEDAGQFWQIYGLHFTAYDPYWYGDFLASPAATWAIAPPTAFFPLRPMVFTLSESSVLGVTGNTVSNPGDVEAYPIWTLTGPATALTLTAGDRSFTLNSTLAAGETVEVNTDPAVSTVIDGTGANRFADLANGFDLWPLPPGDVDFVITVSGSGTGTELDMDFRPRYLKS